MSHILFITQVSPFPTDGGERIRSLNVIKLLSSLGHEISAIVANQDNLTLEPPSLEKVRFFSFPFTGGGKNIIRNFYKDNSLLKLVRNIEHSKPVDIVFLDFGFLGQYISFFKKMGKPVIYGSHNAQSQLTRQRPTLSIRENLRKALFYWSQYLHERIYFPGADVFLTVSEDDARYYSFVGAHKIKIIRNFLDLQEYSPVAEKENYLGFPANFFAYQNYEGMKWFLEEVWDKSLADHAEILLIGKGSKEALSRFAEHRDIDGSIKATGNVADAKPYIAKAKAIIIPLQHGSGTRIKCLEAMALNSRIISTRKGIEGIRYGDSVLIGNSAPEFRDQILKVLHDRVDHAINSAEIVKENYSLESLQGKMNNLLSAVLTTSGTN